MSFLIRDDLTRRDRDPLRYCNREICESDWKLPQLPYLFVYLVPLIRAEQTKAPLFSMQCHTSAIVLCGVRQQENPDLQLMDHSLSLPIHRTGTFVD
jgi:hypothetical protein